MTRTHASRVAVTRPIHRQLPGIYQEHEFVRAFTGGLDDVWAPLLGTLDCLHAIVDPNVTPPDFLEWLGRWVGTVLEEDWSVPRRRRFIAAACGVYAKRGTPSGLRREIELYTDGRVEIVDPGSTRTSAVPGASFRNVEHGADRTVRVTVDVADGSTVNWSGLQELIRDAVPAHLPVEIDLRELDDPSGDPSATDGERDATTEEEST